MRVLERDGGYVTISAEITANEFIEKELFNSKFVMILSGIGIVISIIATPIVLFLTIKTSKMVKYMEMENEKFIE